MSCSSDKALHYRHRPIGDDSHIFDVSFTADYSEDPVDGMSLGDLPRLTASPDWEDRVRAQVLLGRRHVKLPDQFPCIHETPDSPSHRGHVPRALFAWVISPDIEMLRALLPVYQELWDAYTSQWGPSSRRTLAVGRLDGLDPQRVYRPGTTPAQVIGHALLVHDGMYQRAPEHLKAMCPRHEQWTRLP